MRCNIVRLVAFVAMLGVVNTAAWAFPPSNPFVVPPSLLQMAPAGLTVNRTGDFSGNSQASTAVVSSLPNGLQVNASWSTGASFVNETFTRIVLTQQYDGNYGGDGDRGDLDAFDGVSWVVTSDIPLTIKPYTQVGGTFQFYEGTQPGTNTANAGEFGIPGGNVPTLVQIDWDTVNGGPIPDGSPGGRGDIFEHGFQVFGPSPAQDSGEVIQSVFTITNVPEPTSLALGLFGAAVFGLAGRRRK